jgi:hypothetical protein
MHKKMHADRGICVHKGRREVLALARRETADAQSFNQDSEKNREVGRGEKAKRG